MGNPPFPVSIPPQPENTGENGQAERKAEARTKAPLFEVRMFTCQSQPVLPASTASIHYGKREGQFEITKQGK